MALDILLFSTVMVCVATDLRSRKIYNKVLLPALVIGVGLSVYNNGLSGLINSGLGFATGLALLLFPFILGGIGGGDVKLLATIGAMKGHHFVIATFLGMGIAGGLIAVAILLYQRRLITVVKSMAYSLWLMVISGGQIKEGVANNKQFYFPYGVAISLGVLVAYMNG